MGHFLLIEQIKLNEAVTMDEADLDNFLAQLSGEVPDNEPELPDEATLLAAQELKSKCRRLIQSKLEHMSTLKQHLALLQVIFKLFDRVESNFFRCQSDVESAFAREEAKIQQQAYKQQNRHSREPRWRTPYFVDKNGQVNFRDPFNDLNYLDASGR